jgi:hypothetical protein
MLSCEKVQHCPDNIFCNSIFVGNKSYLVEDNETMSIKFLDDSRCPLIVQCIYAGTIDFVLKWEKNNNTKLDTISYSGGIESKAQIFKGLGNHNITLRVKDVTPYPEDITQIPEEDYKYYLEFEK